MQVLTLSLPTLYGDHHVIEVRRILQAINGVSEVYASSSFQLVQISYDPTKTSEDNLRATLEGAGYLREFAFPTEAGVAGTESNGSETYFRHTAVYETTKQAISFAQQVSYSGRPLWPCPGFGVIEQIDEEE